MKDFKFIFKDVQVELPKHDSIVVVKAFSLEDDIFSKDAMRPRYCLFYNKDFYVISWNEKESKQDLTKTDDTKLFVIEWSYLPTLLEKEVRENQTWTVPKLDAVPKLDTNQEK